MTLAELVAAADGAIAPPFSRLIRGVPLRDAVRAVSAGGAEALLHPASVVDAPAGRAVLAGALTYLDGFDEAHEVAQALPEWAGSWWHAILHRREPDASNAGYWYRRVRMPADLSAAIGAAARGAFKAGPGGSGPACSRGGGFDPLTFVAACEAARAAPEDPALVAALAEVQRVEWRLLMDRCVAVATGRGGPSR